MAVIFDEVKKYRCLPLQASMAKALQGLKLDLAGKKSAFIKVNIVRPARPGSAVVTHPAVAEALIRVLRDSGIKDIAVGEGPAVGVDAERAFGKSGYASLARKTGVRLLDLHRSERKKVPWAYGDLELPLEAMSSDIYITVAKMKTHYHTGVTLAVKSQQGLLTPQAKKANHKDRDLHRSLVAIAGAIRPDWVIIDGIEAMEGEGPTQGKKKRTEVMVYGDDLFETDIACCYFMGVDPGKIEHLRRAVEEGLASFESQVKDRAAALCRSVFAMPSPKPKRLLNFYSWKNYRACAEDDHCFEEAIHWALGKPKYWIPFFPKFLKFVLFRRFHLLRGKGARIPEEPGRVLCLGDCCRDVAAERGADFVPGCPPKPEDIIKTVARMK
jgi:uncharacterized protein (DUF362 family)